MAEVIDESVSVDLFFNHVKRYSAPWTLYWRGNRYMIKKIGLHHTVRDGRTLFHVFSVTDGSTFFNLRFNTDTLEWKLLEVEAEG